MVSYGGMILLFLSPYSMKISIITSCFNREATIRYAIESVLSQDYPDIEYIIIDGASKDNSLSIINEYNDRISTIVSEPDHGMYEAINKGIRMATGDIIGLVHSDDFLFSNDTISHIVEEFNKTGADFIYGDGLFVDYDNTNKVIRKWIGGEYRMWKVKHGWLPLHPTCYMRRDVMLKYDFIMKLIKLQLILTCYFAIWLVVAYLCHICMKIS